jgi:uncharacterized protein
MQEFEQRPDDTKSLREEQPVEQRSDDERTGNWIAGPPAQLVQAVIFGLVFGFLLQKGGVAKFDILIGVLLLEDFTVVKVMLTAVIVGMVGVYVLHRAGLVQLQINETVYGANILGGLIFGIGFGLLGYCPGTNAAAVGQGNYDAVVGLLGLALGSYFFARTSASFPGALVNWGQRGKQTLPEAIGVSRGAVVAVAAPLLLILLVLLEVYGG